MRAIRVRAIRVLATILLITVGFASHAAGQETGPQIPVVAPPNILLLVRQEIQYGKGSARQKLSVAAARMADRLSVPYSWQDLQSITGSREAFTLSPFDTFDQLEQSIAGWDQIYAAHAELARLREQKEELLTEEDTVIALRRDDLGYRVSDIDLAAARFMRVINVHVLPGHENDFTEAAKILSDAYEKTRVDTPWTVYQVKMGMTSSNFLILMPMSFLKQNDDLILPEEIMQNAEDGESARHMEQVVREAFASSTNNLYVISNETSHWAKDLTSGEPNAGNSTAPSTAVPNPAGASAPKNSGKN